MAMAALTAIHYNCIRQHDAKISRNSLMLAREELMHLCEVA